MADKVKILAYCDFACATGFSTVATNILTELHNTGKYDVVVLGINHHGFLHPYPFPVYPVGVAGSGDRDPYGRKWVAQMMKSQEYDILFTIQDSFILEFMAEVISDLRQKNPRMKWINYFPVDGLPKKKWLDAMALADYPVTYTKWAVEQCEKVCPEMQNKIRYIYHGINTKDFFPLTLDDAQLFKSEYFGPLASKFLVVQVNRNQQRKDIPRGMVAFREFNKMHPESVFYVHAAVVDHGWNLLDVAKTVGLEPNVNICFPDNFGPNQGFPVEIVNRIYNAADVVMSSTTGEGWGLAQTEAMACCKPVISPDNTACTEIMGDDRGLLVKSGKDINLHTILPNDNEVVRPLIDINDMIAKLCFVHEKRAEAQKLALNGYKWVTSSLRWDKNIVPAWKALFEEAQEAASSPVESEKAVAFMEV